MGLKVTDFMGLIPAAPDRDWETRSAEKNKKL